MPPRKDAIKVMFIALLVTYAVFLVLVLSGLFPLNEATLISISLAVGIVEGILVFLMVKGKPTHSSDAALNELKERLDRIRNA